jgi:hypothetical protein
MTSGSWIGLGEEAPERLQAAMAQVLDSSGFTVPASGANQGMHEVARAMEHLGK